jgi:putative sterol carrier protein
VTAWLTVEWFDETRALAADQPERPGLTGRVQVELTGGPDGDVECYGVLVDGRLAESAPGRIDHPDVTVALPWADGAAVATGSLDPNVAFMQGRMKVAGSMGLVMDLLAVTATPEYRDLRARWAAVTDV